MLNLSQKDSIMLVERRAELELLTETFADCVAGKGRVALISGGLASGKTELMHAFTEQVADAGALVLTATATRTEQPLRMGVVGQLFRAAGVPKEVSDRVRELTGPAAGSADALAVSGICGVLLELAENRPLVIAVDDVQFVDDASLEVLRYLRCRTRSARLLMVLTEWERPSLARPAARAELTRQPQCRITLGPLSEDGVAELLARRLGRGAADQLAGACYALCGGNPFLVGALIEDQARQGARVELDAPVVGPAFREAVLDCLHRWDTECHQVAAGMAILDTHSSVEHVAELVRLRPNQVSQAVDLLTAAGLAASGQLRHAEIAGTVLQCLSSPDRSRLHARAAELLYREGIDALDVAEQLAAADTMPEPWAVWPLRHAADQSLAEDAGLTVKYLELAVRACADEHERVALRANLVRAAWRVNPAVAQRHITPLRAALRAGELEWKDAGPVIRHLLWQGDLDAAAEQLRAMHAVAGHADSRTAAELRLAGEWIYGRLRERVPEDVHAWLATTDGATPAYPWRRTATLNTAWSRGATGEMVSVAEHVLQGCLGDVLPEVGATALLALDGAGRQQRAMYWCEALLDEAVRQKATTWQAVLGCVRADIAYRRGDLATARAHASNALELLQPQSWGVLIGFPLSVLILANTAMGDHAAAAELLDRTVPEAMFETAFGLRYLHASGHYNLASGRPLAALDDFERCGAAMRRWGVDVPAMIPWRTDQAQALLELGMRTEARALAAEQLGRPMVVVGPRARAISLRVLAACSEPAERKRILVEAVQILERCADRLELARALTDLSHTYRALGDSDNARPALRRAGQIAKACQAIGPPAANGAEPGARQGGRRPGSAESGGALSKAERKVAVLAANGHSNREISRLLFITVSTVEQHLTSVYRKLKVSGRSALSAAMPAELTGDESLDDVEVRAKPVAAVGVQKESRVLVSR